MKIKIAITVAVCALFVAVPSATPKGRSVAGVTLTVSCIENTDATDTCAVTATGLPRGTYNVVVIDACGGSLNSYGSANFNFSVRLSDCTTALTVELFSVDSKGALTPVTATFTVPPSV